jgi:hypothetical protein
LPDSPFEGCASSAADGLLSDAEAAPVMPIVASNAQTNPNPRTLRIEVSFSFRPLWTPPSAVRVPSRHRCLARESAGNTGLARGRGVYPYLYRVSVMRFARDTFVGVDAL